MFIALRRRKQKNWGYLAFSWEEFSLLGNSDCELPPKQSSTVCQIIYSGMTGEPKGIFVTNAALMSEVLSTNHILFLTDRGQLSASQMFLALKGRRTGGILLFMGGIFSVEKFRL